MTKEEQWIIYTMPSFRRNVDVPRSNAERSIMMLHEEMFLAGRQNERRLKLKLER
jgi:hypothetical protein